MWTYRHWADDWLTDRWLFDVVDKLCVLIIRCLWQLGRRVSVALLTWDVFVLCALLLSLAASVVMVIVFYCVALVQCAIIILSVHQHSPVLCQNSQSILVLWTSVPPKIWLKFHSGTFDHIGWEVCGIEPLTQLLRTQLVRLALSGCNVSGTSWVCSNCEMPLNVSSWMITLTALTLSRCYSC